MCFLVVDGWMGVWIWERKQTTHVSVAPNLCAALRWCFNSFYHEHHRTKVIPYGYRVV